MCAAEMLETNLMYYLHDYQLNCTELHKTLQEFQIVKLPAAEGAAGD